MSGTLNRFPNNKKTLIVTIYSKDSKTMRDKALETVQTKFQEHPNVMDKYDIIYIVVRSDKNDIKYDVL